MVQGVQISDDGVIQNVNPATSELIQPRVSVTTPAELSEVIATANAAQVAWNDVPLVERIALIRNGLAAVEPIAQKLADTITEEMGKIPAEAKVEVDNAIELKDAWLDMVKEANEDVTLSDGEKESVIIRDPLGVVCVISPWNVSLECDHIVFVCQSCEVW